jgi:hypothetical protein
MLVILSHHECGDGEFLAGDGPAGTLEFVVEFGESADDSAERGFTPASAAFGCVALFAEQEVVFA